MLEVDIRIRRGERLFTATLTVGPGETVAVVGPSGAGKSTVVRSILGLVLPESGSISCGEAVWFRSADRTDLRPRDRRVGAVVQELALFPHLSAWRNVAFASRGLTRAERRPDAVAWLRRLGIDDRADVRPDALSGGQRQRVALARALAGPSTALVLDEPFSALDDTTHDVAAACVRDVIAERRIPAIVVTHDPDDAARLGARTATMTDDVLHVDGPSAPSAGD
ncbi:ATP-binding cassette domain-containing protein [Patulibacter minatonensis]|uniref:ATP-binding cassette domain-containing protein n=1 Tax=Patulibacter minatonensis TaxID=298163 RepID=UPI0004B80E0B|nr:ATP-binding cassette domain-containing protein [Patulibacter minatonensis]